MRETKEEKKEKQYDEMQLKYQNEIFKDLGIKKPTKKNILDLQSIISEIYSIGYFERKNEENYKTTTKNIIKLNKEEIVLLLEVLDFYYQDEETEDFETKLLEIMKLEDKLNNYYDTLINKK